MNILQTKPTKGQVFLIGALLVGLILLSLAVLLNLAIFSENSASRGSAVAEERALDGLENTQRLHYRTMNNITEERITNRNEIQVSTRESYEIIQQSESDRSQLKSSQTRITNNNFGYGVVVGQNEFTQYQSINDESDWEITDSSFFFNDGVEISQAKQSFNTNSVSSFDEDQLDNNEQRNSAFETEFNEVNRLPRQISVFIYNDQEENETVLKIIATGRGMGSGGECRTSEIGTVTVDYIEEEFAGEECNPLSPISDNEWLISYENGNRIQGVYGFMFEDIVNSGIDQSNVAEYDDSTTEVPFYHEGVYEVSYDYEYRDRKYEFTSSELQVGELPSDMYE